MTTHLSLELIFASNKAFLINQRSTSRCAADPWQASGRENSNQSCDEPDTIIKDKNPGLPHEQGGLVAEKKICGEDGLALCQLPMRLLQIELDTEAINELDDGVGVIAVLHDPHKILHETAHLVLGSAGALDDAALAEEQGGSEVAQEMGGFELRQLHVRRNCCTGYPTLTLQSSLIPFSLLHQPGLGMSDRYVFFTPLTFASSS